MESILLHPEKGVNPFIMQCMHCGKNTGIVLLGRRQYIDVCNNCDTCVIGGFDREGCPKCGRHERHRKPIHDGDRLAGGICEGCQRFNTEAYNAAVESNAIILRCDKCGMRAVLRGDHELAIAARKERPEYDHKPLGLRVTAEQCPRCQGRYEELCADVDVDRIMEKEEQERERLAAEQTPEGTPEV